MLQQTARRVASGIEGELAFDPPLVICGDEHAPLVREQLAAAGLPGGALVLEPVGRSTGACAVVAATVIGAQDPEALVLLLPSDHHVADPEGFRAAVARAAPAAREGHLVTFGVRAARPETGYGYIFAEGEGDVLPVQRFIEKPDAATAAAYVADGRFFWNAGIFLMRADILLEEMTRFEPEILEQAREALGRATEVEGGLRLDEAALRACPLESLDRAVMERTARAAVAPIDIGWSDVGSFEALWETAEKDDDGNVSTETAALLGASGCLVRSDGPVVALLGVEDLIVVVDKGVVLVTRRDQSQGVKQVVDRLRADGRDDLL
jgi:mannose-1-phosphate guanylyltransferase/mannose-1-phosphate guanylyltransferase/mannose-6-phosphate isomerase